MRPLKLRLENFACFRGRAFELDFAPLELFAIAGPTGAGKSSLLDAMIFALYGRVPRIGGRGAAEMISLGADRMSVAFDFRVGADAYRVTRVARRRSAGTAQLERLGMNGDARPLKDGVREVEDEIARIVGLSHEAFTQAVVLPQGELQKFLKSAPRDRREILTRILRLQIYERMRDMAARRRDRFGQSIEQGERRLAEDYAEATPQALAQMNVQADALGAEIEALSGQRGEAEERRDALRTGRAKTRELEQRRTRLLELDAAEPAIRAAEARLEAARRAAPVLPLIQAAHAAKARAAAAERTYDSACKEHAQIEADRNEAKKRIEQATKNAEEIPGLVQRIAALDQIIGRMRPRPGLVETLAEAGALRAETARKLEEARNARRQAESELAAARQRLVAAEAALAAAPFNPPLFAILDDSREDAGRIANLRAEVGTRAAEVCSGTDRLTEQEAALSFAVAAEARAEQAWRRRSQVLQGIEEERAQARHRAAAAVLRRELRIGQPCPVCARAVAEHPPALATPALDALQEKFERAQTAETEARSGVEKAKSAAAGARAAAAAARDSLDQSTRRQNAASAELAGKCEALEEKIREHLAISGDQPIEAQVQDAWRRATAAKQRHEAAHAACGDAERTALAREREAERHGHTATQLADRLTADDNRIAEIARQIAEIDAEVRGVTAKDPAAERKTLERRRSTLETARQESQDADRRTATGLAVAAARLEDSDSARKTAWEDARRDGEAARAAAVAAGFLDADGAAEAELGRQEQQLIGEEARAHREERRAVEVLIGELAGELRGEEVTQSALDAAEDAVNALSDRLINARGSRARLDEQIRALTVAIERADALRQELEKQRAEHRVFHGLALDLQSNRFQAFLLEETFRELVAGASARLWGLTKRYRFHWQDEAFQVVDHDNARQMRSADTLSGGETFLASLALALQLSEQVQNAAGAAMLDSLFIDEGFGALDPEALDAAASAIESLPVGGRMVGIITHIDELSLRLPARLRVGKTPDGSRLTVETG
jgi:exonuclease SbcC